MAEGGIVRRHMTNGNEGGEAFIKLNALQLVDLFNDKRREWDAHIRAGVAAAQTEHDVQGWECMSIGCKVLIEFAVVAALHSAGVE